VSKRLAETMADLQMLQSQEEGLIAKEKYDALDSELKQSFAQMNDSKIQISEMVSLFVNSSRQD
jgi:hypothetical protein